MPKSNPTNPFYALLVVVGVLFVLTTCGYAVLAVKGSRPQDTPQVSASGQRLLELLDRHGVTAIMIELAILAVCTFAAIGTDDYWARRAAARQACASDDSAGDSS